MVLLGKGKWQGGRVRKRVGQRVATRKSQHSKLHTQPPEKTHCHPALHLEACVLQHDALEALLGGAADQLKLGACGWSQGGKLGGAREWPGMPCSWARLEK